MTAMTTIRERTTIGDAPVNGEPAVPVVRFGDFEVDVRTGELWKNGGRLTLQSQPLSVLAACSNALARSTPSP